MNFNNKIVWITGASSGIGEALAYAFAKQGEKLVLSARRENELQRVKNGCTGSPDILLLPFDLEDTSKVDILTQQVIKYFGRIDILINNGGISQRSLTKDTPIELDRKLMEVNYFSYVALTKSLLPQFIKQNSGHIVVISSIAGKFGFHLRSGYSASKHALHGFFESLRMEVYDNNIQVLMVCPGKIKTNVSINAITESGAKLNEMEASHEKAMSGEDCAAQIVRAISKNKYEVFIGGGELNAVRLKRFFPNLFFRIIRKVKSN